VLNHSFSFEPTMLAIPTGATVTWHNDGEAPHTATAENGSFDPDRPGTYDYACAFYPELVGAVVAV